MTDRRSAITETRYVTALATVLRGSALPYGYTVTVWTSGMMLVRHRGLPSTAEVFLFMLGAVVAYATLGGVVRAGRGVPFDPAAGLLRHTGMLHLLAVGGALGAATLVALIPSAVAWPFGSFAATGTYLGLATLELLIVGRGR